IIRGKKECVLNRYLLYFLQWKKEYLLQLASAGATRNALTKGMIEQLEIDLPSLDKQTKIAALMGGLDDKIELNNKINENLERQVAEIYKSWFQDFSRAANLPLEETEFGLIPQGWHYVLLGDICKSVSVTHKFD